MGLPLVAPVLLLDTLLPQMRSLFVRKKRYATADAQLLLAFMNLYAVSGQKAYLGKARSLAQALLDISIPGYSGHCWGYPFDWQHSKALWPKNTPYITCTPYCFEAFLALHDATGEKQHLCVAESIARFVFHDLNDTETSIDASAGSYSPLDQSKVINASAYRAYVLLEAAARFEDSSYRETGLKNLRFVLHSQNEDGSWLYELDNPQGAFIDHFHTCFVLKNLHKINRRLKDPAIVKAVADGFAYYRERLFDAAGTPVPFAVRPRTQIVKQDLYNYAEAITLCVLLGDKMVEAIPTAHRLARDLVRSYQLPDGHFVGKVFFGGRRHTLPFMRWPQAQLFYAVTNLLVATAVPSRARDAEV